MNALVWSKTQRIIAENASARLEPDALADWVKVRQDFDRDPTKPNPYEEPEACTYFPLGLWPPSSHLHQQSLPWTR